MLWKGKKTRGAYPFASPSKRTRKSVRWKQVPASITQALEETVFDEDLHCSSQTMDTNLDSIMNMLIDMSSRLQAKEETMQQMTAEMAATPTMSPSITRVDWGRARVCHQQSPWVLNLSEDVRERVARRCKILPIIVSMYTYEGSSSEEDPLAPCRKHPLKAGKV